MSLSIILIDAPYCTVHYTCANAKRPRQPELIGLHAGWKRRQIQFIKIANDGSTTLHYLCQNYAYENHPIIDLIC